MSAQKTANKKPFIKTLNAMNRTFTTEQSTAVRSLTVNDDTINISFQTNPDREYTYSVTPDFKNRLMSIMSSDEVQGLGGLIAEGRRTRSLQEVTV